MPYPRQSKIIGELQLVFRVRNKDMEGELGIVYTPKYSGAIVKLLQWHQWESVNLIYEVKS